MGRIVELALPRLGETMDEGRIGTILKRPSEAFRRGDTLLEVESDKTTVEVPALQDGILVEWLVAADQQVAVGAAIARIEIEGEAIGEVARPPAMPAPPPPPRSSPAPRLTAPPPVAAGRPRASTAARVAARRAGIDLAAIAGTGRNGRTTSDDVAAALRPSRTTRRIATLDGEVHVREWAPAGRPRAQALLLHGLFSDSQSFTSLGRKLAVEGVRAQAPDLPGHGESSSAAADPAAIAAAVRSCLPADKVHIVAHSFGAVVAAALLDRALSLTLLAPAGCGEEISQAFLDAMIAGRIDHAAALLGETIPPEAQAALADRLATRSGQLRAIALAAAEGGRQKLSILAPLAGATVPVDAIFMRDDAVIPSHHALNMPFSVSVRIMPGAGHLPHWRDTDAVLGCLRTVLAR